MACLSSHSIRNINNESKTTSIKVKRSIIYAKKKQQKNQIRHQCLHHSLYDNEAYCGSDSDSDSDIEDGDYFLHVYASIFSTQSKVEKRPIRVKIFDPKKVKNIPMTLS